MRRPSRLAVLVTLSLANAFLLALDWLLWLIFVLTGAIYGSALIPMNWGPVASVAVTIASAWRPANRTAVRINLLLTVLHLVPIALLTLLRWLAHRG